MSFCCQVPLTQHFETRGGISEKTISIRVSGFKDYYSINCRTTGTQLVPREIDKTIAYGRICL